jgi:hypothetical protein
VFTESIDDIRQLIHIIENLKHCLDVRSSISSDLDKKNPGMKDCFCFNTTVKSCATIGNVIAKRIPSR